MKKDTLKRVFKIQIKNYLAFFSIFDIDYKIRGYDKLQSLDDVW